MSSRSVRVLVLTAVLVAAGVGAYWQLHRPAELPAGLASGNGRLEATEIDVASKVAGRLASVEAREGDAVNRGQILARLDGEDLDAQLRAAEAQARQAGEAIGEARAGIASAASQQKLAVQTVERTRQLIEKGFVTNDRLDRDESALQGAVAALAAARSRASEAQAAQAAAEARAAALRVNVDDLILKAPQNGRVLYRLAEPGEVIAAGGKVLTLLDLSDVHVSIYLASEEAGRVALGSSARIVLDALPGQVLPARVVFLAPRAQFTPKEVETRNEREKLMFRVKLQVDAEWLAAHGELAKPGMPGVAYVQTAADAVWPPALTPSR
jgi:HlyD family secretion protein